MGPFRYPARRPVAGSALVHGRRGYDLPVGSLIERAFVTTVVSFAAPGCHTPFVGSIGIPPKPNARTNARRGDARWNRTRTS